MAEDWSAVSKAIEQRLAELGIRQRDLAERSQVSQATIRELQYNTRQRRRSARTLEAISVALEWQPGHLSALLVGERPPNAAAETEQTDPVLSRLDAIESQLRRIREKLGAIDARLSGLDSHANK